MPSGQQGSAKYTSGTAGTAPVDLLTCTAGTTANSTDLIVEVDATALATASDGAYTDTVTLLMEPI
ncbi:MAG: hypothetical protein QS721_01620 [Candidatus Endonucleobacter sp. (ex Gigantidas childressi)]|nr:hypothetical protein [Candidatus Endonucleobacter sp. (ex Gigantidas childressi)]